MTYNCIANSLTEFEECQDYALVEKHKIPYPSKERWLVLEIVAKRLIEQWGALSLYFFSFLASVIANDAKKASGGERTHTGPKNCFVHIEKI